MSFLKPISTSLSPNTEKDDIQLTWKLKFQPWKWRKGEAIKELEKKFKNYLRINYAVSFNSGRSALMAILEAMEVGKGDEILLQAFTCNSAVNPILEKGARPVYIDIDDTLNLNPSVLRGKITSRTRAIMVQHNFGWPAKIEEISKIAKENNLFLIEDCAHSRGARFKGKLCGTFGDAAFFSFGRDKIISSVFGGMAVTGDAKIGERIIKFQEKLDFPSVGWIGQQLRHPVLMNYLILPAYLIHPSLGRIGLGILHKISVLSKAVYREEKEGKMNYLFPKLLPNAFAVLALNQFGKLEKFNNHRREIAAFYRRELKNTKYVLPLSRETEKDAEATFMRYPLLTDKDTDEILRKARGKRIFLDDGWRKSPVVPPDTDLNKMQYIAGSCPQAEKAAESIINLPTHVNISKEDARKIIGFLKSIE